MMEWFIGTVRFMMESNHVARPNDAPRSSLDAEN